MKLSYIILAAEEVIVTYELQSVMFILFSQVDSYVTCYYKYIFKGSFIYVPPLFREVTYIRLYFLSLHISPLQFIHNHTSQAVPFTFHGLDG